jgi:hypothetical protein
VRAKGNFAFSQKTFAVIIGLAIIAGYLLNFSLA